jgi:hypothetical protein
MKKADLAKVKDEVENFFTTAREAPFSGDITIHGPSGHGKTWFMGSASTYWPSPEWFVTPVEERTWIKLEDLLWLPYDDGALDGFKAHKIDVPVFDVRKMIAKHGIGKTMRRVPDELATFFAQNPAIKFAAHDTISEQDKFRQRELRSKEWGDPRQMWGVLADDHARYRMDAKDAGVNYGVRNLFSCHSAAKVEQSGVGDKAAAAAEVEKVKKLATRTPGGASIQVDISGKGHDSYINNSSLVISIRTIKKKGQPDERKAQLTSVGNFEGKNRFQGILNDEMEAHLGKMLARLEAIALAN